MVDSPFNEDFKNINFFQGSANLGEGWPEYFGKISNIGDINCYANREYSILKDNVRPYPWYQNPCDASTLIHARPQLNYQTKIWPFFRVPPSQNI